jgi:hypothetical protein
VDLKITFGAIDLLPSICRFLMATLEAALGITIIFFRSGIRALQRGRVFAGKAQTRGAPAG